jgi:hypothetical protein
VFVFGRWTLLRRSNRRDSHGWFWVCRCSCGDREVEVHSRSLRRQQSRSCGCLAKELARAKKTTHGDTWRGGRRKEYSTWNGILQRCTNPNNEKFYLYGGRGVTVCERWLKYENFLADMGRCPHPGWTVERTDNAEGYSPDNCIWAPTKVQIDNRRNVVKYTIEGVEKPLYEWADEKGFCRKTVLDRWQRGERGDRLFRPPDHDGRKRCNRE